MVQPDAYALVARWSGGPAGIRGGAWPADGGTDGLGRSLSVDSSGQGS